MLSATTGTAWDGSVTVSIPETWIFGIAGAIALGLLGWAGQWLKPRLLAILDGMRRVRRAERAVDVSSPGLWLAPKIDKEMPDRYKQRLANSIPIIVVANLKGGVGKTTTVANLIAHYDSNKAKKILAIDLDFQGSLSANILSAEERTNEGQLQADGNPSKSAQLIDGRDGAWLRNIAVSVDGTQKARCVPSYYTLSSTENRVMVEWLIAKRRDDVRYSLARTLLDLDIQNSFDIILIDAPPRLTTAAVQALCAATHVLVPTILDGLSVEATGGFLNQLATNQPIWPHLQLLGVFGNMTQRLATESEGVEQESRLLEYEADQLRTLDDTITEALRMATPPMRAPANAALTFPLNCFIPEKAELGRAAGERIAYRRSGGSLATQQLSRAFDRLGDEIDRRI